MIDIFAHIFPKVYQKERLSINVDPVVDQFFRQQLVMTHASDDAIEVRLKSLDKCGVDIQALSLSYPGLEGLQSNEAVRLARESNDAIAKVVDKYPDRFVGIADLPLVAGDLAIEELERTVKDLGFKGLQLFSNINGKPLDSPEFFSLYSKIVALGVPILFIQRF